MTIVTVNHFSADTTECKKNNFLEKTYGLLTKDSSIEFSIQSKAPERSAKLIKIILKIRCLVFFFRVIYEIKDAKNKEYENA